MGSSKKHKKGRSRLREKDSHKRTHKSHRCKDKAHSPGRFSEGNEPQTSSDKKRFPEEKVSTREEYGHEEQERPKSSRKTIPARELSPDLDLDIDQLLDSKLSENPEFAVVKPRSGRKRRREFIDEIKRRQNENSEDALGKIFSRQPVEDHGSTSRYARSSESSHNTEFRIKEEPNEDEHTESPYEAKSEPQLSLSISETNKLRMKLGLKPLDVGDRIPGLSEDHEKVTTAAAEVFVKTENIAEKKRAEDLREKLKVIKEKRVIEEKLRKTKSLGESESEDESAVKWVKKHQRLQEEKETAAKRAKMLEEMDAEFGIGALVEEEFDKKKTYTSRNLKGMTISHDVGAFREGQKVILTLKDKDVLNEDEDVLENVNILDDERYAQNVENKKKKPDYKPYEEPEYDEFGILKKKNLLSKYDEEIEGQKKKSFKIGSSSNTAYVSKEQELELIRMKLKQQNEVTLEMPHMKIANEYYTTEDMVKFKKPKKKIRKIRKQHILKADDLLTDVSNNFGGDLGSRRMRMQIDIESMDYSTDSIQFNSNHGIPGLSNVLTKDDEMSVSDDLSAVVIDEDQAEKELHNALSKARKLTQRKIQTTPLDNVTDILGNTNKKSKGPKDDPKAVNIELNSVAEFCRTLGEIPTYGMAGNRDEEGDEMMDLERELLEERQQQEIEAQNRGAWNEVYTEEKPAEISIRENEPILEEEPDISLGVAGALKLAMKKGYLDKEPKKLSNASGASQLQAQSYTIEEKFYEDDKFGKRDRYTGPTQEFREKCNYKPVVNLEYIDDSGRLLTEKEAFRYLSHRFHGKGSGKNKVDKRMKKVERDTRLKQMSSTDTPLNTVKLLQAKQKETQSPYIVLSGGNKTLTQTMISKTKPT